MGKDKRRRVYIHKPTPRQTIASSSTQTRIRRVFSDAPAVQHPARDHECHDSQHLDFSGFIQPSDDAEHLGLANDSENAPAEGDTCPSGIRIKLKSKRYVNSDTPLLTWRDKYRDNYLDATLLLEGRGRFARDCSHCHSADPRYRCQTCHGGRMLCRKCILKKHQDEPLHIIEEWKNAYFQVISLQKLGMRYQLGHPPGDICPLAIPGHVDFVVIASNGIHCINLDFCGCIQALANHDQLLEIAWWPATPIEPQTAATMDVLRMFQIVNLQARTPPTDFYIALEQMTDGCGLQKLPDRLPQWMLMLREWRHIKMAKRAGRAFEATGIEATKQGELAIPCRACPQPGINLPAGWEHAPDDVRWLYALILAEDANFKLKGRLRSSDEKDPPLGPGWATFVNNEEYQKHLMRFVTQSQEISHCVMFSAMSKANSKGWKGLRATGVGSVSCARHEMFRPNGTGDLQKGERYANMDFIFLSSIVKTALPMITISYDIACQWSKNLMTRMKDMPPSLQIPPHVRMQYRVPKFHLPAHTERCHAPYSFNYTNWVGRTDGEGVERNWSSLNGAARCVAIMTPGGRQDTLDDFCNFCNWRKTIGLGDGLLRKLTLAIPEAIIQHRAFQTFTASLREEHSDKLSEWECQIQAWDLDKSKPCPYELPRNEVTLADIKQQLAEEEHQKVESGEASTAELSPSAFLIMGLQIEEFQQSIQIDAAKPSLTSIQTTSLQMRRTHLLKKINKFTELQAIYMPLLRQHIDIVHDHGDNSSSKSELIKIYLPSSIPVQTRPIVCAHGLPEIEDRLRYGQATEALSHLRRQLRARTVAKKYKAKNVDSQRAYTRTRELQDQIERKINTHKTQYRAAWEALVSLRGLGGWATVLQPLKREDIRGLHEREMTGEEAEEHRRTQAMAGLPAVGDSIPLEENVLTVEFSSGLATGEGQRTLSWIWYTASDEELSGNAIHASIRVEWAKARARAYRWKEELRLLEEEMRRVLEYCWWKARWWTSQAARRRTGDASLDEGLKAYAVQQADIERRRAFQWEQQWYAIRARAQAVTNGELSVEGQYHPIQNRWNSVPELVVELTLSEDREDELEEM